MEPALEAGQLWLDQRSSNENSTTEMPPSSPITTDGHCGVKITCEAAVGYLNVLLLAGYEERGTLTV